MYYVHIYMIFINILHYIHQSEGFRNGLWEFLGAWIAMGLGPGGELFAAAAAAAAADPHGNFEERGPRQFQRVQQSLPYKNNSI